MSNRKLPRREVPDVRPGGLHLPIFRKRAAIYVDGMNLYHALEELDRNYLKWLDLFALGRVIAPGSEVVRRVVWCTAYAPRDRKAAQRHQRYHEALAATGVRCLTGHFLITADGCNACGHNWSVAVEKQSDVNLALAMVDDAFEDVFDVAYLVTADGDQAATARFLKERFPHKRLVAVSPPNRRWNKALLDWADAKVMLTPAHLEAALLPAEVGGVKRPGVYAPPRLPGPRGHLALVASNE